MAGARRVVVKSSYQSKILDLMTACADENGVGGCLSCPVLAKCQAFNDNLDRLNKATYNRCVSELRAIKAQRDAAAVSSSS